MVLLFQTVELFMFCVGLNISAPIVGLHSLVGFFGEQVKITAQMGWLYSLDMASSLWLWQWKSEG